MLRRLRVWFVRLLTGQGEHERLGRLLALLRANGVTRYRTAAIHLELGPQEEPKDTGQLPGTKLPTDAELLFGADEATLRREGLA